MCVCVCVWVCVGVRVWVLRLYFRFIWSEGGFQWSSCFRKILLNGWTTAFVYQLSQEEQHRYEQPDRVRHEHHEHLSRARKCIINGVTIVMVLLGSSLLLSEEYFPVPQAYYIGSPLLLSELYSRPLPYGPCRYKQCHCLYPRRSASILHSRYSAKFRTLFFL